MNVKRIVYDSLGSYFKRYLTRFFIVFGATFLQIYWSMGELSDRISGSSPNFWFVEDAFWMSFLTAIFLTALFVFTSKIKEEYLNKSIDFILLVFVWFFWNYSIFVDRESSWSSYDFESEMHYTFTKSFVPKFMMALVTIMILSKIQNIAQKSSKQ